MQRGNTYTWTRLAFIFISGLVLLFLVAPLLGLFFSTSLPDLFQAAADVQVQQSIGLTLGVSALTTLIAAVFALPLAYLMARKDFRGKALLQGLIDIPIVLPHSAAGIAVLGCIARDSALGRLADLFGLNLVGSPFAIGVAMAFVSIPFLIIPPGTGSRLCRCGSSRLPLPWERRLSGCSDKSHCLWQSLPYFRDSYSCSPAV